MRVRDAVATDVAWLPQYILDGFDQRDYTPSLPRITAAIEACMRDEFALIADDEKGPAAVLGGLVQPIFWAEGSEITVLALRATRPGAGLLLLNEMYRRVALRFDIRHVVINLDPNNTGRSVDRLMRRFGARPMRSFLCRL